jgi:cobalamin biosynthesis Co2+ chelatase CbiK
LNTTEVNLKLKTNQYKSFIIDSLHTIYISNIDKIESQLERWSKHIKQIIEKEIKSINEIINYISSSKYNDDKRWVKDNFKSKRSVKKS